MAEESNLDEKNLDVDSFLEERERLDKMFQDKFTKVFTALKGSTSLADSQGDITTRTLIERHNDIVFPALEKNNGLFVKTMGAGTTSYFLNAQDAVRASADIQRGIDELNIKKTIPSPILIRIGIHTGQGIAAQNDIFGDVVNVASRFESQANPGEIYLSEETYNALTDKSEIYCRFIKTTTLTGTRDPFKIYKAFWDPKEIELDMTEKAPVKQKEIKEGLSPMIKILLIVIPILVLLFIILEESGVFKSNNSGERRSEQQTVRTQ